MHKKETFYKNNYMKTLILIHVAISLVGILTGLVVPCRGPEESLSMMPLLSETEKYA